MIATKEKIMNALDNNQCVCCFEELSDKNVFTAAGWEETKISNMCEICFDLLFEEDDDK